MNYEIKKVRPEDLSVETINSLRVARFGKDWVKFCEDTFEGGYQAVYKVLRSHYTKSLVEKQVEKISVAEAPRKKNAVDRSLALLSKHFCDIDNGSRKFLCQNAQYARFELSEKQNKWLSDLEARFGL